MANLTERLPVAVVGCGAVTKAFHGPALQSAERMGLCQVTALYDPSPEGVAAVRAMFPAAVPIASLEELQNMAPGLALVASPAKYHAQQTITALGAGWGVLCEKPMAATVQEAEDMIAASERAQRPLCIGMIRRHLPAIQAIRQVLQSGVLGKPLQFTVAEGGPFGWPVASAQFFHREHAHGGVLHDIGVHVLDLCALWFGNPSAVEYEDDAMGNMEANCLAGLQYPSGLTGVIRLSRDWKTINQTRIGCERGWVAWRPLEAQRFEMALEGVEEVYQVNLAAPNPQWPFSEAQVPALTFHQCLVKQIQNALEAAQGVAEPVVSGEQALHSLRVIEQCYAARRLMPMPWLSSAERGRAEMLAA